MELQGYRGGRPCGAMWRDHNSRMLRWYLPCGRPELPGIVQEDKVFRIVGHDDPALLSGEQKLLLIAGMAPVQ